MCDPERFPGPRGYLSHRYALERFAAESDQDTIRCRPTKFKFAKLTAYTCVLEPMNDRSPNARPKQADVKFPPKLWQPAFSAEDEAGLLRVIPKLGNCAVLDLLDRLVDDEQRH